MNVADKALCQELYAVSGWTATRDYWVDDVCRSLTHMPSNPSVDIIPAYDLGYLLQKLPASLKSPHRSFFSLRRIDENSWQCGYRAFWGKGSTAQDATAMLCIELFKQNIITPNQRERE